MAPTGRESRTLPQVEIGSADDATCLIVEDDHCLRDLVTSYLENHGVRVICASHPREVPPLLACNRPDLIVLDLWFGRECGLDLLRELRARSDTPIIITTGRLQDEIDRVVGLELGADDYITKSFGLRELLARIRAVLRGREPRPTKRKRESDTGRLCFGGWQLERRACRLTDPRGKPVALTRGQYELLMAFLGPLSRKHLLHATRIHADVFARSIDTQVTRLRRKLEKGSSGPSIIRAERRVGYVFTLPVTSS